MPTPFQPICGGLSAESPQPDLFEADFLCSEKSGLQKRENGAPVPLGTTRKTHVQSLLRPLYFPLAYGIIPANLTKQ